MALPPRTQYRGGHCFACAPQLVSTSIVESHIIRLVDPNGYGVCPRMDHPMGLTRLPLKANVQEAIEAPIFRHYVGRSQR